MCKSKKYYWLKLKDNFFDNKAMKKLRKIAGGDTYTIIYLKLLLKSMQTDGKLYFDGIEETFCEELALDIDEDTENVKITVMYLQKVGLLKEINEKEIELIEIHDMVGSESSSAERVRRMRTKKKLLGEPGIDEKRYGGNGLAVLERDNFRCVKCGSDKNICIHHKNGFSNNLEDLTTLCRKCHANLGVDAQENVTSNALTVTCNADVTKCNTEKEKEKEKDIDIEKEIYKERKEEKKSHSKQTVDKKKNSTTFDTLIENYTNNEQLRKELKEHLKTRKQKKAALTDRALELSLKKLDELASKDSEKIKIVQKAIMNGWVSFYPLKPDEKQKPTKYASTNIFEELLNEEKEKEEIELANDKYKDLGGIYG